MGSAVSHPYDGSSSSSSRLEQGRNQWRRRTVAGVVVLAMISCYVYTPIPDGVTQPWKARQVLTLLRTIGHISYASEKLGLSSRFNTTRYVVDFLSRIPPKNYAGLQVEDTYFDGVKVRLYMPDDRSVPGPAVFFIHGGGWFMGSIESHDHITSAFAQKLKVVVVSVEYRLCPENPYPAPLDDSLRALQYLVDNASQYGVDRNRIAIVGDSAGGNLAAAVTLKLRDTQGAFRPRLQVLVYPLLQASDMQLPSHLHNDGAVLGTRHEVAGVILLYIGQDDRLAPLLLANRHLVESTRTNHHSILNTTHLPQRFLNNYHRPKPETIRPKLAKRLKKYIEDPYCMPLTARDLSGIPETLIVTAQYDVLRDEGVLYSQRLHNAGVKVTWRNYEHSYHGMLAFFDQPVHTEEGEQMMDDTVGFIKDRL